MYRNFNIYAFAVRLLPTFLRTDVIKAILWAILNPLDELISKFNSIVTESDRRLSHNSFTIYLEKFLNDLFSVQELIYITDYIDDWSVCLSMKEELRDYDIMTMREEELPTIVLPSDRPSTLRGYFIVNIPASLDTQENRALIARWVIYYKFAGTNFIIKQYE